MRKFKFRGITSLVTVRLLKLGYCIYSWNCLKIDKQHNRSCGLGILNFNNYMWHEVKLLGNTSETIPLYKVKTTLYGESYILF